MGNEINEALGSLKPKGKDPHSVSVLTRWIAEAENQIGDGRSGRLSWLVASVVVTAKLQEVVDDLGRPVFLLKGGSLEAKTMMLHRWIILRKRTAEWRRYDHGCESDKMPRLRSERRIRWCPDCSSLRILRG